MDDKSLQLSEKFSTLVIDAAIRSQGTTLLERLAQHIADSNRGELARLQASIAELRQDFIQLHNSTRTLSASLNKQSHGMDQRGGSAAGNADAQSKRMLEAIDNLRIGFAELRDTVESLQNGRSQGMLASAAAEVWRRQPSTNAPSSGAPESFRATPAVRIDENADPHEVHETSKWRRWGLNAARGKVLAAVVVLLLGATIGALATFKILQPAAAIAAKVERPRKMPVESGAATKEAERSQDFWGTKDTSSGEDEASATASTSSGSVDQYVNDLIYTLIRSVTREQLNLLTAHFKQHGIELSTSAPTTASVSLRDLEAVTRGESSRTIAAYLLQTLILKENKEFKIDGEFRGQSLKALSQLACLADAQGLKRDDKTQSLTDPQAHVIDIIRACALG